jgi:hypothetical protein
VEEIFVFTSDNQGYFSAMCIRTSQNTSASVLPELTGPRNYQMYPLEVLIHGIPSIIIFSSSMLSVLSFDFLLSDVKNNTT